MVSTFNQLSLTVSSFRFRRMPKLRIGLCPSLNHDILDKLHQNGIFSVCDFIAEDYEQLSKKLAISYKDVATMRRMLLAQFSALTVSAADLYDDLLKSVSILPTGCSQLDTLLEGGFYCTEVSEVTGALGVGKTQLCLNVAKTLAQEGEQNTLWIDTCGSFSLERLNHILEMNEVHPKVQEEICGRIHVQHAFDIMQLLLVLEGFKQTLITNTGRDRSGGVRLLVVDSVTSVLAPLLSGYTPDGYSMMMQTAQTLKQIASEHSVAVLLTNNLVGGDGPSGKKPALGRAWACVPQSRLLIRRENTQHIHPHGNHQHPEPSEQYRTASLIKSNRQPCQDTAAFVITDGGLQDYQLPPR